MLENYVNLNCVALKKILKKFDKNFKHNFGSSISIDFISKKLEGNNSDLLYLFQFKMIDEATAIIDYLLDDLNCLFLVLYKQLKVSNVKNKSNKYNDFYMMSSNKNNNNSYNNSYNNYDYNDIKNKLLTSSNNNNNNNNNNNELLSKNYNKNYITMDTNYICTENNINDFVTDYNCTVPNENNYTGNIILYFIIYFN